MAWPLLDGPRERGRGSGSSSPIQPAHPPRSEKFPPDKNEVCQKAAKSDANFRDANFCLGSDPLPTPPDPGVGVFCHSAMAW